MKTFFPGTDFLNNVDFEKNYNILSFNGDFPRLTIDNVAAFVSNSKEPVDPDIRARARTRDVRSTSEKIFGKSTGTGGARCRRRQATKSRDA